MNLEREDKEGNEGEMERKIMGEKWNKENGRTEEEKCVVQD